VRLAASDPNRSLYCNQADSGIPWQKQVKATIVYPLPWYGISVSAALQNLNGYLSGTAAQAYGGFTAGTGFDSPNGLWYLLPRGADDPVCGRLQGRVHAWCIGVAGDGRQRRGIDQRPARGSGTEFTPRINQLDFSVSKAFEFGTIRATPRLGSIQRAQLG
jgi:hypothetical protein